MKENAHNIDFFLYIGNMTVSERILKLIRYSLREIHGVDFDDVDGGSSFSGKRSDDGNNNNNIPTSTTLICPPPNAITYSILLK